MSKRSFAKCKLMICLSMPSIESFQQQVEVAKMDFVRLLQEGGNNVVSCDGSTIDSFESIKRRYLCWSYSTD